MSKVVEKQGYAYLAHYVSENLSGASLRPTMNKGRGTTEDVADAVLDHNGQSFDIEIKAFSRVPDTNLRFTHQTLSKSLHRDLIVALIWNLADPQNTDIRFFRLGDVQDLFIVEPRFIIQSRPLKGRDGVLSAKLADVLGRNGTPLQLSKLLDSKVSDHMKIPNDKGKRAES